MINITHSTSPLKRHKLERHYGEIVELAIRKSGYSITELARLTNVNRRTVYNWFVQKNLSVQIIYRIGVVLRHDFSKEFPELFSKDDFEEINMKDRNIVTASNNLKEPTEYLWKDRYTTLLDSYNKFLYTMQADKENRSILKKTTQVVLLFSSLMIQQSVSI